MTIAFNALYPKLAPSSAESPHISRSHSLGNDRAATALPFGEDRAVTIETTFLRHKKLALAIGGGIAAVEAVKLIRALRRHGAEVYVYTSPQALKFITPLALEWASTHPIISDASAKAEHIFSMDMLIVAPTTLSLLAKSALGICDSLIATLIASALGQSLGQLPHGHNRAQHNITLPILMVPSMHASLAEHPLYAKYRQTLRAWGVTFTMGHFSEGKWKTPHCEEIVLAACRLNAKVEKSFLVGKKIFITAGAVPAYIDDVRMLTNVATGATGNELAIYAHALGGEVTLLTYAKTFVGQYSSTLATLLESNRLPLATYTFRDYDDYKAQTIKLLAEGKQDWGIFVAAVSDYKAKQPFSGKLASTALTRIEVDVTEKIVRRVRKTFPKLRIIAFKLEAQVSLAALIKKGKTLLKEENYSVVVLNRLEDLTAPKTQDKTASPSSSLIYPRRYVVRAGDDGYQVVHGNLELAKILFSPDA